MDIVKEYQDRVASLYLQTHPNADPSRVKQLVDEITLRDFKDPRCKMDNNVYHETFDTTLTNVIEWIDQRQPIIAGNGTFFMQHEEYLSPTVVMLETLQKDRKVVKKEMFSFKKGTVEYKNRNLSQGNIKVIMNADYGGSGTPQSPFYSVYIPPATTGSAKNITTTLICCLEMASGNNNKWAILNNINELFDFIYIVLADKEERELIEYTYTVDEVTDRLVNMTNNLMLSEIKLIRSFVESLSIDQRTKLMLAYNVKRILTDHLSTSVHEVMTYFKAHKLQINNLTDTNIHDSGFGVKAPDEVESAIKYINKVICDNCVYPYIPNDAEIRADQMEDRMIVCVTDTDSLMVHFAHYIEEFQAEDPDYKMACLLGTALGMRVFVEAVIPKYVGYVAEGANIKDKYYRDKFVFKNEFAFLAMALFAKKMYASSMFVQEGVARNIHDIAVTGMSFKKRDAAKFLEPIMLEWYDKYVLTGDKIEPGKILDEFYQLRDKLYREIRYDASYYKVLGLKSEEAYEKSKTLPAQMRGAIVWNGLFPDEEMLPMDRVKVVPLSFEEMHKHEMEDPRIAQTLKYCLINNESEKTDPYICLPEHYKSIPEWIQPIIDIDTLIDKTLAPCKQLLGLFDIYMADTKGGMIPSRMVFL